MIKKTLLLVSFLAINLILIQCSDDSTGPDNSGSGNANTAQRFSGITLTNDKGEVLGGDSTDWCYSSGKGILAFSRPLDVVPDSYALYPAYANPSKGPVRIDYDLPVAANVHLYIIDSTETVIRELVNENQQAGRYAVIWDQWDDSGQFVDSQIYGCLMEAGNFECFGDIRIESMPDHVILYATQTNDTMNVSYKASIALGGLILVFDYSGVAGDPIYEPIAFGMIRWVNKGNDSVEVNLLPDISNPAVMPSGQHDLFSIPIDGVMTLRTVDASDSTGLIKLPATILNIP